MLKDTTVKLSRSIMFTYFVCDLICLLLVFTMASVVYNHFVSVIITIVNILIFVSMIYGCSWNEGYRDVNRVNYNQMEKCMLKGLYAGLIADIPFLLFYLAVLVTNLIHWHYHITLVILYFTNMQFFYPLTWISGNPYLTILFGIPLPVVSAVGYLIGYKRVSLTSRIIYKGKPKTKKA